jgi:hypothetical protein
VPRARRPSTLTLLLAVAPLVSACDGGEGRHCVGPDGVYLADGCCEPGAACNAPGAHWVYVPHRYYGGVGSHAGAWRSSTSPSRGSSSGAVSRGGFGGHGAGAHGSGG